MKKQFTAMCVLIVLVCSFVLAACAAQPPAPEENLPPAPGDNFPDATTLILNGKKLDVYTSHYWLEEEYAEIPLGAFLSSIGAEFADSPLNEYGIQCYSLLGKRYILIGDLHLFMPEEDYIAFLAELEESGQALSRETAADRGLLPLNESFIPMMINRTPEESGGIWTDHVSLMNALRESGIDITIEYDYAARTITVTLP